MWPEMAGGSQIVSIYFDPNTDTYFRAANGTLWRSRGTYDRAHRRLRILYEVRGMLMFVVDQPDADHLLLAPLGPTGADITPLSHPHLTPSNLPCSRGPHPLGQRV